MTTDMCRIKSKIPNRGKDEIQEHYYACWRQFQTGCKLTGFCKEKKICMNFQHKKFINVPKKHDK